MQIETHAIHICQRPPDMLGIDEFIKEYDFFVFTLSSKRLLKIAKFLSRKDSELGIQRVHKEDRDKEIGRFITSEHPFFPNNIIINIPIDFRNEFFDGNILSFDIERNSAYVIDGQHRLKAFQSRYSEGVHLDLVVSAYFNIELPTIAEIFTRINFYQKPVTKSLVYDLLKFNRDPEFEKYRTAHEITNRLNSKIGSIFYGSIKMLGIGSGFISQAAFVEALSTRYKIVELLNENYSTDQIASIIDRYFKSAHRSFRSNAALSKVAFKTMGFNAMIKVLNRLIKVNNEHDLMSIDFSVYTNKMADIDFEELSAFGGFKGVNTLAERFIEALEEEEML